MSKKLSTLYVRGLNESNDEIEDVWDDTILNNAYDKALRMANEEVAKRIAMETNSKKKKDAKAKPKTIPVDETPETKPAPSKKVSEWKAGMPCRAVYDYDGLEYEAFLIKLVNEKECIVKFLGYENSERVPISCLKPTLGNAERMRQVEAALGERDDDGFESNACSESVDGPSDAPSSEPAGRANNKKKKANKKKKNTSAGFDFGDFPSLPMPNMNMFRQMGADMPILMPPPPLATLTNRSDAEEQAISDMLLSWYMTGYYTGLYQQKRAERRGRRNY